MLLAVDGLKDGIDRGSGSGAVVVADHPATGCHGGGRSLSAGQAPHPAWTGWLRPLHPRRGESLQAFMLAAFKTRLQDTNDA